MAAWAKFRAFFSGWPTVGGSPLLTWSRGSYSSRSRSRIAKKRAFRDAFGQLWENERCGFGSKTLLPAFDSMVAGLLGDSKGDGVENYLENVLIYSGDFDQHLALIRSRSSTRPLARGGTFGKLRDV